MGQEPDQRMHGYLAQPMIAMRDPVFLPQLAGLVQRTNVSNNFRQLLAAGIAELPGPEAENAFTQLVASSDHGALEFAMEAFRLIHRPPVPFGLIIWNAPKKPRDGGFIMADVITHYAGGEIRTHRDLWAAANATSPDARVPVRVWRAGSEVTLQIKGGTGHYNFWKARASREIRR